LARSMRIYLQAQVDAGADVVQLFDTWAGLLSPDQFRHWAAPAARQALAGLAAPTIYFAPGAAHLVEFFHMVGATAYGVDWRLPLHPAQKLVGEGTPVQGNLDPSVLLCNSETVRAATVAVLEAGKAGHIFNLGHGILPETPVESVEEMVSTVVEWHPGLAAATFGEDDHS